MNNLIQKIETKVIAAAAGSGGGVVVASFAEWLMGVLIWHASNTAAEAIHAISAVPSPVTALLTFTITVAGAAIGGYAAPHTVRTATESAPPADSLSATLPPLE
jgi:hypothetical protein